MSKRASAESNSNVATAIAVPSGVVVAAVVVVVVAPVTEQNTAYRQTAEGGSSEVEPFSEPL